MKEVLREYFFRLWMLLEGKYILLIERMLIEFFKFLGLVRVVIRVEV